jgi:tRNA synthetases class II (D, K and N)/OB-fold nucleic acid binding domain
MHERILVSELANHVGERVTVMGWLHRLRELSQVAFLIVRDRSGLGQVVITEPAEATKLPAETVLAVTGEVLASDQAPGGAELHEPRIEVLAAPPEPPPLELWRPSLAASLPTQLDLAPLALRHPRRRAAFELAAASLAGFRSAMQGLGFTEVQTPKIVASATESGANVFALDYFGGPAFLAQSPQLYKQMMVGVFERVFETGPVFRAEPHDTARHLSEFVSLDAELGFISDHRDVMGVVREAFAGMVEAMSVRARGALELLALELPEVPSEIPWLPDAGPAVLHAPRSGAPRVLERLRPPVPGHGADHGRSAASQVRGLPVRAGQPRGVAGSLPALSTGVQVRDAAPRRLCDWPRALDRTCGGRGQCPRGHPVSQGHAPAHPLSSGPYDASTPAMPGAQQITARQPGSGTRHPVARPALPLPGPSRPAPGRA